MKVIPYAASLLLLSGCITTQPQPPQTTASITVLKAAPVSPSQPLSLEQIMADPDWIGRSPEQFYWGADSHTVYYSQKQLGTPQRDRIAHRVGEQPVTIPLIHWGSVAQPGKWHDGQHAWLYQGNLFVQEGTTAVTQLTFGLGDIEGFRWLSDGRIAYWHHNQVWTLSPTNPQPKLLAQFEFSDAPSAPEAKTYLAKQQQRLSRYLTQQQQHSQNQFELEQQRQQHDEHTAKPPFYLGDDEALAELSLSPSGRYLLLALIDIDANWRADHDIMPNYVTQTGYVDAIPVRARVAEAETKPHRLVVLDTQTGTKVDVTYEGLTGFAEDVLAAVKTENHQAQGKEYVSKPKLRTIRLMQDRGWKQSAMVWQENDDVVAVMLEAVDNKDRWIATLDLKKGKLNTEHRLHDDAWINYTHNEFGWIGQRLYFLSEQSGYSNLYLKSLGEREQALVSGKLLVSQLTVSKDGSSIYYRANPTHPGQYEVFKVNLDSGNIKQLTNLNGMVDYRLSPDETTLLLAHSTLTRPTELYTLKVDARSPKRLTHTITTEFAEYPWQAPQIVAVPSSHQHQPVYSRLYLPTDYDSNKQYPAVIFNHGAGYLQNSHFGWSGYFREYMFHNLLAQQGYVVMDMDYRGSKGYGRDWRTAIYRNMGAPEIEDLADGIDWMVNNASVDRQRIGTYGGSYGGFMTFMAMFNQPDLFQAGAALRPVTDWAHYNHGYTSNILNTPKDDHIAYERSSPIYHAEGLSKPLLIMAGVLDNNVFFQDSVRLVQRLIELEKPMFETAIYPVEPHGFRQPSSWLDEYRRIFRLFETEVK